MKKIVLQYGECRRLAKLFRCTIQTVSCALNFKGNSEKQVKIRTYALKNGGVLIKEN
jgi:hypothetical protein